MHTLVVQGSHGRLETPCFGHFNYNDNHSQNQGTSYRASLLQDTQGRVTVKAHLGEAEVKRYRYEILTIVEKLHSGFINPDYNHLLCIRFNLKQLNQIFL